MMFFNKFPLYQYNIVEAILYETGHDQISSCKEIELKNKCLNI